MTKPSTLRRRPAARAARVGHVALLLAALAAGSLAAAGVSAPRGEAAADRKPTEREGAGEATRGESVTRRPVIPPGFRPAWERPTPPPAPTLVAPLAEEAAIESYFEGGDRVKLARLRAWANDRGRIPELELEADPHMYEEHRDHARSLFKELARDYLRRRLGVDAWTERLRARWRARRGGGEAGERRPSGPGFDVGPRLRVSDDPELGVEIEGEGSPLLSRLQLTVDRALASGATYGRLSYADGRRGLELTFAAADPRFGDTVGVGVRFTF